MATVLVTLPVAAIRPDLPQTLDGFTSVLSTLSRTDTLFHCARLNSVVSKGTPSSSFIDTQRRALRILDLGPETRAKIEAFAQRYGGAENVSLIYRGALLELMRWATILCRDHSEDGTTFLQADRRENLFVAILYAGELWGRRVYPTIHRATGTSVDASAHRLALLRRAFEGSAVTESLPVSFGRGWELFHDGMIEELPDIEEWFGTATGLTLEDNFAITFMVNHVYQESVESMPGGTPGNVGIFDVARFGESTKSPDKFGRYLAYATRDVDALAAAFWPRGCPTAESFDSPRAYPMAVLRSHPILRTADGRAIILDPICFRDLVLAGVIFRVASDRRQAALNAFGRAFETYGQRILRRIYPKPPLTVDPLSLNERFCVDGVEVAECDGIVSQGTDAIVFEIKAAWLPDDTLPVGREREFLAAFESRYGSERGTGQLASILRWMRAQPRDAWPENLRRTNTVFPVLVTYDSRLDERFRSHLAARFAEQLAEGGGSSVVEQGPSDNATFRIAPLCAISVDELESLEEIAKRAPLIDVLRGYAFSAPESRWTLEEFLVRSEFNALRRHNQHLVDVGIAALERIERMLLGG